MKKRIIAMLLAIVTVFSVAAVPAGAVVEEKRKIDIVDIWQNGYPMPDLGAIVESLFAVNKVLYQITGLRIFTDEVLVITVNDTLSGLVNGVMEATGVDFSKIYNNLPQSNYYAELITSKLNLNIPEVQNYLTDLSREYFSDGNLIMGALIRIVCIWLGVVDEVKFTTRPYNNPGCSELGLEITYRDGRTEGVYTGLIYDRNTNQLVGKNGEPALFGYSLDLSQNYVYTGINVWQRSLGFNIFYDIFCYLTPFFFHYTTQRIKFNYDEKDWMIQVWKGRYAITNGGEVGIYTRPESKSGTFYDCAADEDMLVMSISVYHGDQLIFSREPMLHWWMTGFSISDTAYLPHSLTLISTITMKDAEMLEAVTASLDKMFGLIKYEVDGLDVTITW